MTETMHPAEMELRLALIESTLVQLTLQGTSVLTIDTVQRSVLDFIALARKSPSAPHLRQGAFVAWSGLTEGLARVAPAAPAVAPPAPTA